MIRRLSARTLRERLAGHPAVALVGPRQCGKTTLARSLGGRYFDLEQDADRLKLDLSWDRLVAGRDLVVLDEAQAWPVVFPRLRGAIDHERRRNGRFLLLGSVSPALMTTVAESLAGRLSLVELTPFLLPELGERALDALWLHGGFPDGGCRDAARFPRWQSDYLDLLAQRDLPNWGLPARPALIHRLMRMTAALHGQAWNASQVAQSLGLSYMTVNRYLEYLEGAFLVRRLPPLLGHLRKRLVRTPRLYWRDTGLLHALHGIDSRDRLLAQPWVGASWEGFVLGQILDALGAGRGLEEPSFFRTADGHEVDLVFALRGRRWATEVKLTTSPSPEDFRRLDRAAELCGADVRVLVSRTTDAVEGDGRISCSLWWLLRRLGREAAA
jgi:hypothetical protein